MLRRVVWYKFTDVPEVLAASIIRSMPIALMMGVTSTYETSVNFCQISRHNIPEDSYLLTHFSSMEVRVSNSKRACSATSEAAHTYSR
jgi:hypothetical protein